MQAPRPRRRHTAVAIKQALHTPTVNLPRAKPHSGKQTHGVYRGAPPLVRQVRQVGQVRCTRRANATRIPPLPSRCLNGIFSCVTFDFQQLKVYIIQRNFYNFWQGDFWEEQRQLIYVFSTVPPAKAARNCLCSAVSFFLSRFRCSTVSRTVQKIRMSLQTVFSELPLPWVSHFRIRQI